MTSSYTLPASVSPKGTSPPADQGILNCDNAELFLNGKSLGAGTKQQDGVFVWNNVKLAAQTANSIKVVAHNGSKSYEDSVDGVTYGMQFEDVNASTPHSEDIQWLADNGITEGWVDATGKRTFRGMDTVKRQIWLPS